MSIYWTLNLPAVFLEWSAWDQAADPKGSTFHGPLGKPNVPYVEGTFSYNEEGRRDRNDKVLSAKKKLDEWVEVSNNKKSTKH